MHPYINESVYDWNELLRYYQGLKATYDTDQILVGSKRAIGSIKTNDLSREDFTMKMPNIKNYTYIDHIGLTTIEWSDGTKTTVRAENPARADQYTGFVTAYAKKAAGNTNNINNLFDE